MVMNAFNLENSKIISSSKQPKEVLQKHRPPLGHFQYQKVNRGRLIRFQTTNFRLFQTEKKKADDNFKFYENGRKFLKRV